MKKYVFAFLIWVMIIPIAILNGGFREYVLVKLGGLALPLSGIILSICIFTATNQIEGGKEVNEAAAIMVATSSPAIKGARVSSSAVRQAGLNLMKKKIKKVDAGKKIAKKSVKKATKNSIKKVAKGTTKKVAKETAKETAKVTAKVTTQVATTAAGGATGPYKFLEDNGYRNDFNDGRLHHEIYMSDARKVAPCKWKTVIRHPICKL